MINFYASTSLLAPQMAECKPWDWKLPANYSQIKALPKPQRRKYMLGAQANWNIYSSVRALAANQRVSKLNPPVGLNGLVADYDMVSDMDTICGYLSQISQAYWPTYIEFSLSSKVRLVWTFERELMVSSSEHCAEIICELFQTMGIPTLLPGYDANSEKPAEVWTNGGVWANVEGAKPLSWTFVFGMAVKASKKLRNGSCEIPFDRIVEEVKVRFPNKWAGDFTIDATGVRFWDPKADNTTGCQIKPDGMLCFTGTVPFMKWSDIFGKEWVLNQQILNVERAAAGLWFDGKDYWTERSKDSWMPITRADAVTRLKVNGVSDKIPKGTTSSEVDRVIIGVQQQNYIVGAGPFINYPPGIITLDDQRVLNISTLKLVTPVKGDIEHFPFLWNFLTGFFAHAEAQPLHHFLAWTQRFLRALTSHQRLMGHALFICGPRDSGKTLISERILKPLFGNKTACPMDFFTGDTTFNDDVFRATLLTINDEDAPKNDAARTKFLSRVKAIVVNPFHRFSAKFRTPLTLEWCGRFIATLNDEPGAVGLLPEVNHSTEDKMMYFRAVPYAGRWGSQQETEAYIARELPYFAWWLLNEYEAPEDIIVSGRMGIKYYYDPDILRISRQQAFSFNLSELIREWTRTSSTWEGISEWTGTPTGLLSEVNLNDATTSIARGWSQHSVARSLTALARTENSGVKFAEGNVREFVIQKSHFE